MRKKEWENNKKELMRKIKKEIREKIFINIDENFFTEHYTDEEGNLIEPYIDAEARIFLNEKCIFETSDEKWTKEHQKYVNVSTEYMERKTNQKGIYCCDDFLDKIALISEEGFVQLDDPLIRGFYIFSDEFEYEKINIEKENIDFVKEMIKFKKEVDLQ